MCCSQCRVLRIKDKLSSSQKPELKQQNMDRITTISTSIQKQEKWKAWQSPVCSNSEIPVADTGGGGPLTLPWGGRMLPDQTRLSWKNFFVHVLTGPDYAPCEVLYLLWSFLKQALNNITFLEGVELLKPNSCSLKFGSLSHFISQIVTSLQVFRYQKHKFIVNSLENLIGFCLNQVSYIIQ